MEYKLPEGKKSRTYKVVNKENDEVVVDGSLKDVKVLFAVPKEKFVVVKDFARKVNEWCVENNHELTIGGMSYSEAYPKGK